MGGVGSGAARGAGDLHRELVTGGVDAAAHRDLDQLAFGLELRELRLGVGDGGGQHPLVAGVGAFEPFQPCHLGVDAGLLEDPRVAGC